MVKKPHKIKRAHGVPLLEKGLDPGRAISMEEAFREPSPRRFVGEQVKQLIDEVESKIPATIPAIVTSIDPGVKQPWMDSTPMRRCTACNQYREFIYFERVPGAPEGYSQVCKVCRPPGISLVSGGEIIRTGKGGRPRLGAERHKVRALLVAANSRAFRLGVPFELQNHLDELEKKVLGACEMTGVQFTLDKPLAADAPSLYLIDPAKGFIYTNVRVICWAMNCALGTWGADVLRIIVNGWMKKGS